MIEGLKFENYNRPNNAVKLGDGTNTLPNAFSHWTYKATNGKFMIVDIQGWKKGSG